MVRESKYILLSSLLVSSSIALERARLAPQSLVSRANYEGSWALGIPGSECPSDTPVTCSQSSIATLECCPSGNTCFGLSSSYCCPSKVDCETAVRNFPTCFNTTWQLYEYKSTPYYFCCPPGQYGVIPIGGYGGICQYNDVAVAASRLATLVEGETAAATGSTVASTARTTRTATITSTRSDGVEVTITQEVAGKTTITKSASATDGAVQVPSGSDGTSSGSTSTSSKSGLGAGAIAGIVIGSLGVLALFLVAFLLYRRNSRKGVANQGPGPETYSETAQHGSAPVYTAVPQQTPHNYPIPASELKSPTVSAATPDTSGYLRTQDQNFGSDVPSPVDHNPQGVHGNAVEAPVPQRWEGRAEIGPGR